MKGNLLAAENNNHDDNTKDDKTTKIYVAKLDHLLKNTTNTTKTNTQEEGLLVALILLVNPNLVDTVNFQRLWIEHGSHLQEFCQRLLWTPSGSSSGSSSDGTTMNSSDCCCYYAQFIVLLLERILSISDENFRRKTSSSASFLMKLVLEWFTVSTQQYPKDNSSTPPKNNAMQMTTLQKIIECCNTYCTVSGDSDSIIIFHNLRGIWNGYVRAILLDNNDNPSTNNKNNNNPPKQKDEALMMMEQVLHGILLKMDTQLSEQGDNNNKQGQRNKLDASMQELFRHHLLRVFASLPNSHQLAPELWSWWYEMILSATTSTSNNTQQQQQQQQQQYSLQKLPKELYRSWHETLLLFARSATSHPFLPDFVKDHPQMGPSVLALVLLHFMSSSAEQSSESLHLLAWTTCAAWVDRFQGYDEMMTTTSPKAPHLPTYNNDANNNNNHNKSLGAASSVCALIRLASGEWRIQLGYRITQREEEDDGSKVVSHNASSATETRAGILQSTSQVLATLVSYLTQVAEDMEDPERRSSSSSSSPNKPSLSPEAMLHLRESLEDTLQATSHYLYQLNRLLPKSDVSKLLDNEDTVCLQLLGTLLTEFDIFDAHTNLDTDEILTALYFAMSHCNGIQATQEQIISSLTTILETARDDSYRVLLLREHQLIGDGMVSFLEQYWSHCMSNTGHLLRSIPWACHLTEVWWMILNENAAELRLQIDPSPLITIIIQWIQYALKQTQQRSSVPEERELLLVQALNAAVGCFVTLHGESPPNEREGQILQEALQYCAVHCP